MTNDMMYCGMHIGWWFIWIVLLIWIFAVPYNIPGQRRLRETPFDILQKRFAGGQIKIDEYNEKKKILENDGAKRK